MNEQYRPIYHFMPQAHWMNDPNGPLFYKGKVHLFYQHNPCGDQWGTIHWGHAASTDFLHWTHWPLALAPDPTAQEQHCYSGCAVLDGDNPALLYTSVGEGKRDACTGADQRLAFSQDGMRSFVRLPLPVLTQALHDEPITQWRDPFVWREVDSWYLVLGGSLDGHGVVMRYRSDDLINWECLGILYEDPTARSCECPNLLTFGERRVLIYSPYGPAVYHTGMIGQDGRFVAMRSGVIDRSGPLGYYAPTTLLNDPSGQLIQWGWIAENAARGSLPIEGYNGALSLPRRIWLGTDNMLRQRPIEALDALRQMPENYPNFALNGALDLKTHGRAYVILETDLTPEDDFAIEVLASPDGFERSIIHIDWPNRRVALEKEHTSLDARPSRKVQEAPLYQADPRLNLAVYVDHSIVEIFINDQEAITGRLYPTRSDAEGIRLTGRAQELSVTIYPMASLTYDVLAP